MNKKEAIASTLDALENLRDVLGGSSLVDEAEDKIAELKELVK